MKCNCAGQEDKMQKRVLVLASVASMIDQFNIPNIRLLQEMGYEVHVLCNFKKGSTCDARRIRELRQMLARIRVICHSWDCPRNIFSVAACLLAGRQLWKLMKRHRYSLIHCQSPVGGALARIVAHYRKIPVIYTAHGFHFYKGAPFQNWMLYYPVERLLSYWTDVLITVNREDYEFARKHLRAGKVFWIPGVGIDVNRYQKSKEEAGRSEMRSWFCSKYHIPQEAKILLSVGELNRGKNHKIVIEALAKLPRQDVYYVICGQGGRKKKLLRYACKMGVAQRLRMPGYQKRMHQIYPNVDIFVFPSRREGMPVALMEAMAAGLPCVVSDIRGNRELIDWHKGALFCPDSAVQLTETLTALLDDEPERNRYGVWNQKKIRKYDSSVVNKRMRRIYEWLKNIGQDLNGDVC